jgi:fluoroacetyl-CoA thioesterase
MIAMMEQCAASLALENLEDGKVTVGFEVCIKHVAAAPEGAECSSPRFCARWSTGASSASTWRCARATVGTHERRVVERAGFGPAPG